MDDDHRHHEVTADGVHQPEEPAIRHLVHDQLDALEGILFVGNIIKQQQDAGKDLEQEGGKGHHAEGVEEIDILRDPILRQL